MINAQLKAVLRESRRTIPDTDMMVFNNLVENVGCGYFRFKIFLYAIPFKI